MTTKTVPTAEAQPPSSPSKSIHITESGREGLKLYEREIATYLREIEPIFVKTIDPRDPERFALLNKQREPPCPS